MNTIHHIANIKSIYRYPIKSMGGEELETAELRWHGIDGDRRYAFVRPGHMSGVPWLIASKLADLVTYRARIVETKPDGLPTVRVQTPDSLDLAVDSEELRRHISAKYGSDVTVMGINNGIFDDSPISVISTTTINKVEAESGRTLDPRRFRPNILIEPVGGAPVDESSWIGKTVYFGNNAQSPAVLITIHDIRCSMVNLDPETAAKDPRVLKTIAESHNTCAGVYATVLKIGTLSVGEGVYMEE